MYGGGDDDDPMVDEMEEIMQEDAWTVISAYFEDKGLVRQQLDSFDEFIQNTLQEIVNESSNIEIRPKSQHNPGRQSDFLETIYKIGFGQIYLSKTMMTESDRETATLFPKAARLRNLTYSAPLYVDVTKRVIKKGHDYEQVTEIEEFTKVFIGKGSSALYIWATLPYIRIEIPIIIVFRALGFVADKDILEHICYDFSDTQFVVLTGKGPSGLDICGDISKLAKEVHLTSRSIDVEVAKLEGHDNIWQHPMIKSVHEDKTVLFHDRSSVFADVVFHCTGCFSSWL